MKDEHNPYTKHALMLTRIFDGLTIEEATMICEATEVVIEDKSLDKGYLIAAGVFGYLRKNYSDARVTGPRVKTVLELSDQIAADRKASSLIPSE